MSALVLAAFIASVLITPAGVASAATSGNDNCGYSDSTFNESTVMRWAQVTGSGTNAQIVAFANDENALLLGVNGATADTGSPAHASPASGGDPSAKDPSGRPLYPALYLTDLTANGTSSKAGDFQSNAPAVNVDANGKPYVDDIFGTWATGAYTNGHYQRDTLPTKNDWNLGSGADAPNGTTFTAMGNEGYGAEVRWNASKLGLIAGHSYRVQIITHDGDQNKNGGDAGEFCTTLTLPAPPPAPAISVVKLQRDGNTGSFTHDVINFTPGDTIYYEIQATNTGNTTLTLSLDDALCDGGTVNGPSSLAGTLNGTTLSPGGAAQYTCSHATSSSDTSAITNVATVTGTPPSGTPVKGTDQVTANPAAVKTQTALLRVVKSQRIGNAGPFTRNVISAKPGSVIEYRLDVITGGTLPLTLTLSDPMCDAGTLSAPQLIKGSLSGLTLTPASGGGEVVFTCSHVLKATDGKLVVINGKKLRRFTNVVNVTGTPRTGTPLHSRSTVTLNVVRKPRPAPNPSRPGRSGHGFTG